MSIIDKFLRLGEGKVLKKLVKIADAVDRLEDEYKALSEKELKAKTADFKKRLEDGESLDSLLVEAFATVREASDRILGLRHFREQIMGGAALHWGNIAEMKTGEGKTLVATLPCYLRALSGKGVHVVTVNDYLASYQGELMGRVYRYLGLTTGIILAQMDPAERRKQYNCDITYGTNNEFGFDYLRDNMAQRVEDLVQRGHNYIIVDEVDSILIDEARTPLIISGPAQGDVNHWYQDFAKVVLTLNRGEDYEVDEKKRTIGVLEPGIDKVEDYLGIDNLYEVANTPLIGFLNNAIKAKELFKLDKDYIVSPEGEVLIVDEHTGRVLPGRRYNEGMHQAIEAKEGVEIKAENQTLATITLQNYVRLYPQGSRAGMTGTAETEAAEFQETYKMGVVPIPTHKPMIREDKQDVVYKSAEAKFAAVVDDIEENYHRGQPVLVGTTSVEKSEYLSRLLNARHIPHQVLNAKQHEREAAVVAMAGRKSQVTVATNMAGRGTDIMLGGNAEFLAVQALKDQGLDPEEDSEAYEAAWPEALEKAKAAVKKEHDEVVELGGLYVLGTERHESRRIDNQLRGRSGRQGDPGKSRFYLSMEDDLMRLFNTGAAARFMQSGMPDDIPLEFKMVSSAIKSAQAQVEGRNAEIRKNVLKYDDVMTEQRETIYGERSQVLHGKNLEPTIESFIEHTVSTAVEGATTAQESSEWDLKTLWAGLKNIYPVSLTVADIENAVGGRSALTSEFISEQLVDDAKLQYELAEKSLAENQIAVAQLGKDPMREMERRVLLSVVDRLWREHLYEMDYLKEGIGLRAMGQRNPLVEYKTEGYLMFKSMMERVKEETVQNVFGYVKAFMEAFEQAQLVEGSETESAVADENAASESRDEAGHSRKSSKPKGRRAGAKSISANRSVMGDTGRAAMSEQVTYSGDDSLEPAVTGNRAQRRASKKRR
ncbi:preprotein translocase subunit SecA [Mobiluncus mulieris]|uniref:preprotein translocase subunit SecA n=1 Tax=Mobiluncus mulieris TaxID=2052 RepID=UPI0021E1F565|nr:preprotein translocase subunit SecA [Mobiluncus mulieris]MCV0002440.1 preprotein translocase subunit SecA [Mobiluncus mulieris]